MRKLLLIPALMLGVSAMATEYNYEISPVIGYNITEGNLNLKDQIIGGVEAQYNGFDSAIKPELSILYSDGIKSKDINPSQKTNMFRIGLNAVYEFAESDAAVVPFAKAGIGYESMSKHIAANSDAPFISTGAGVKIPVAEAIALKVEALYTLKHNEDTAGANMGDSNLALLAGLTFSFGEKAQPVPVDGDDDNDGVLNSIDECPTTPAGEEVDSKGCAIVVPTPVAPVVVDGDDDNDGVLNSVDQCPNTHPNVTKVDADGCAVSVNLHVNFQFDSYEVTEDSHPNIQDFGDFMSDHENYDASIEGHTDSTGPEAYNEKLSQERAQVVADLIVEKSGIDASRLSVVGKGESSPVASNTTKAGRAQNRRTEAHITKN